MPQPGRMVLRQGQSEGRTVDGHVLPQGIERTSSWIMPTKHLECLSSAQGAMWEQKQLMMQSP